MASIGINGVNVNNVNAAPQLLDSDHIKQLARIADTMRPWGVRLAMSVDIASPQKIGGLSTFDPSDPAVRAWWSAKTSEIYTLIPTLPVSLSRPTQRASPARPATAVHPPNAANTLAAALAPHGGVVLYRAFVYNHHADWRDPKADRARARIRHLPSTRRHIRRQCDHSNQGRPHRLPGPGARLAALRRP